MYMELSWIATNSCKMEITCIYGSLLKHNHYLRREDKANIKVDVAYYISRDIIHICIRKSKIGNMKLSFNDVQIQIYTYKHVCLHTMFAVYRFKLTSMLYFFVLVVYTLICAT